MPLRRSKSLWRIFLSLFWLHQEYPDARPIHRSSQGGVRFGAWATVAVDASERPQCQGTATVPGIDDTVLARDMATLGGGRAHMQVARRSRPVSDANRQWFECYNTRTAARLSHYPEADGHPDSGSRRSLTDPNCHDRRVQRDLLDQ